MLSIIIRSHTTGVIQKEITWNIGKELYIAYDEVHLISEIQADGHELTKIIELFCHNISSHPFDRKHTIPLPYTGSVVRWYGDIAKTIIGNLINNQ